MEEPVNKAAWKSCVKLLLTVGVTVVFTVVAHNWLIHYGALLSVKGGYSNLIVMTNGIESYYMDHKEYPKNLHDALGPKQGYAASWAEDFYSKNLVRYFPIEEKGVVTSYVLIYEANPKRYNATFVSFGGERPKIGDWSKLSATPYPYVYIRPGEPHV